MGNPNTTLEKIHSTAMRHFLAEGFQKASLRKIVSEAGFTLGAFYGYYNSKEELFDALAGDTAAEVVAIISRMGDQEDQLPPEQRMTNMTRVFEQGLPELLDYLLNHLDETRLLLKCSAGTKYEHFLDELMERNLNFVKGLSEQRFPLHPLAAKLLVQSYFNLFGDAVLSGESREDILCAMQEIQHMFAGGMIRLLEGEQES